MDDEAVLAAHFYTLHSDGAGDYLHRPTFHLHSLYLCLSWTYVYTAV